MSSTLFLLGAGFNKDAKKEAGKIEVVDCGYPLVHELYKICFPEKGISSSVSIEELFDTEIKRNNYEPLRKLYDTIMKADYHLANKLLLNKECSKNCYNKFFNDFQQSSFLTFNYDSVPEAFLLRLEQWFPQDGYGVPVETEIAFNTPKECKEKASTSLVLHLHGSFCIYTHDVELTPGYNGNIDIIGIKENPEFIFDPDSIADLFHPHTRVFPKIGSYVTIEMRVIAPVPDKAEQLKSNFIEKVYSKSYDLLNDANVLVVIGYNFSTHDKSSYNPLLEHISKKGNGKILIVSPSASEINKRLKSEYSSIEWLSVNATFKEWVDTGYNGIEN